MTDSLKIFGVEFNTAFYDKVNVFSRTFKYDCNKFFSCNEQKKIDEILFCPLIASTELEFLRLNYSEIKLRNSIIIENSIDYKI